MRKNLTVSFKDEASIEIQEAYVYYEEQSEGLGERFLTELGKTIDDIKNAPNGYQAFHSGTRQIPMEVFPFVVVYKVIDKTLFVFAVFQTQQHPRKKNIE